MLACAPSLPVEAGAWGEGDIGVQLAGGGRRRNERAPGPQEQPRPGNARDRGFEGVHALFARGGAAFEIGEGGVGGEFQVSGDHGLPQGREKWRRCPRVAGGGMKIREVFHIGV